MGGYNTAVTGAVITAANHNTYVRDQTVNQFATAAARDAAITAPSEGMVAYLADSDTLWFYSGSAWKPVSWHKISTTTLGGAASTITFSSIPSSYTHLKLVLAARSASASNFDTVLCRFNADTGANYSRVSIGSSNTIGGGSGNVTYAETNGQTSMDLGDIYGASIGDSRVGGHLIVDIPFYSDANFAKHTMSREAAVIGASGWVITNRAGGWFSANAVTQIGLLLSTGSNFIANTRADLYGIA